MTFRTVIEFGTTFPDDTVEEDDDTLEWPGRNIAEALKVALENLDYRVSDPIHAFEHGWELEIWRGRKSIWLQVSRIDEDENYLNTAYRQWLVWPRDKVFPQFLADLHRILEADRRFRQLRWFTKEGSHRGEAPGTGPFDPLTPPG